MSLNSRSPELRVEATIEVDNVVQALRVVDRTVSGPSIEDFVRGPVHDHFIEEIEWRFESNGAGQPWERLHPATEDIRDQMGVGASGPINVRTNEMFETLITDADFMVTGNTVTMSLPGKNISQTAKEKIKTAQKGRKKGENPISSFGPTEPRPVMELDEWDAEQLLVSLNGWLYRRISTGMPF